MRHILLPVVFFLAWAPIVNAGPLDEEFTQLRDQINAANVTQDIKNFAQGFVDFAKTVIDTPGQLTFVSMKQLEIVKCIIKDFFPFDEKVPVMETLNDIAEKLQASPQPPNRPTLLQEPPVDPPDKACSVRIEVLDTDSDTFTVPDFELNRKIRGAFKEIFLKAVPSEPGSVTWCQEFISVLGPLERIDLTQDDEKLGVNGTLTGDVIGIELRERRARELIDGTVKFWYFRIVAKFVSSDGLRRCEDSFKFFWKR